MTPRLRLFILFSMIFLAGLTPRVFAGVSQGETDTSASETPRVLEPVDPPDQETVAAFKHSSVRLAPVVGFDDDADHLRSIADRTTDLSAQAEKESDPARRAVFLLAAANLILSHQLEPICSRNLLHLSIDGDALKNRIAVGKSFDRADALITQTERLLREPIGDGEMSADEHNTLADQTRTLRIFSTALRAYLLSDGGNDSVDLARRAAAGLSPLLEDKRPSVAAAARLWQATLRSRVDDPQRTLTAIDPPLLDPSEDSMPYAFFSRLLRCRLVAQLGGESAALGLLLQMEERCLHWLAGDADRRNALRAVKLVEIQILTDWRKRLSESDAERQWCADRIEALTADGFGKNADTVLRLTPAIPMIAPPPITFAPNDGW